MSAGSVDETCLTWKTFNDLSEQLDRVEGLVVGTVGRVQILLLPSNLRKRIKLKKKGMRILGHIHGKKINSKISCW